MIGDGGGGEEGLVGFELGVVIFKIRCGGKMHSVLFFCSDSSKRRAVRIGLAVFDFGEVDIIIFSRDEVDFVEMSFVVVFDDGVTVLGKVVGDGLFGLRALGGGVFGAGGDWLEAREGFAGFERFAVFVGEAVLVDGGSVSFGAIADVLVKMVIGVF